MALPSLHDHHLIGYAVDCEARTITLRTCAPHLAGSAAAPRTFLFTGVQGYHFQDDAFGNVIFALEEITLGDFLRQHAAELRVSHRTAGALAAWAADPITAQGAPVAQGLRVFTVSSSIGLSGWLLAKDAVELEG